MRIIEIAALPNGAHRNQTGSFASAPEGWAVIPDTLEVPDTFPFIGIAVADGVVTAMTPGMVPAPEPEEPEQPGTDNSALEARVAALEEAVQAGLTLYEEDLGSNG